ncbi:MAG: cation transporting ATPase C-terminal domain-containing protein [Bryobacterales bacterium]
MEGRKTFANTLKYILTTMSANLGNMMSMAAASLVLPFLPLLAGQILLNNFLSDIPAFGLANDSVDREAVTRPGTWNIGFVGRFMLAFGILSSLFDFLTFGVLLTVFHSSVSVFRTGWFVESLLTELAIAFVVRTRRPLFRSRPGTLLLWSSVALAFVAVTIPYFPLLRFLGFAPLPMEVIASLLAITSLYVVSMETLLLRSVRLVRGAVPSSGLSFLRRCELLEGYWDPGLSRLMSSTTRFSPEESDRIVLPPRASRHRRKRPRSLATGLRMCNCLHDMLSNTGPIVAGPFLSPSG